MIVNEVGNRYDETEQLLNFDVSGGCIRGVQNFLDYCRTPRVVGLGRAGVCSCYRSFVVGVSVTILSRMNDSARIFRKMFGAKVVSWCQATTAKFKENL